MLDMSRTALDASSEYNKNVPPATGSEHRDSPLTAGPSRVPDDSDDPPVPPSLILIQDQQESLLGNAGENKTSTQRHASLVECRGRTCAGRKAAAAPRHQA